MKYMSIDKIYIPTLGRAEEKLQHTYKFLPQKYKDITTFVIQESDKDIEFFKDKDILLVPDNTRIAKKREIISRHGCQLGVKFCVFDDDLSFYKRESLFTHKKTRYTEEQFDEMFNLMSVWLDEVVFCGLGTTYTPYPINGKKEFDTNFRNCLNIFYNGKTLPVDNIDWVGCSGAEDFYVAMQLMEQGYPNRVSMVYLVNTVNTTQSKGGASFERNIDNFNASLRFLKDRFPEFVKLKESKVKTDEFNSNKLKLEIAWKKLFKANEQKRQLENLYK